MYSCQVYIQSNESCIYSCQVYIKLHLVTSCTHAIYSCQVYSKEKTVPMSYKVGFGLIMYSCQVYIQSNESCIYSCQVYIKLHLVTSCTHAIYSCQVYSKEKTVPMSYKVGFGLIMYSCQPNESCSCTHANLTGLVNVKLYVWFWKKL